MSTRKPRAWILESKKQPNLVRRLTREEPTAEMRMMADIDGDQYVPLYDYCGCGDVNGITALIERLRAHADCHAHVSQCDDEQKQWAEDLFAAACLLRGAFEALQRIADCEDAPDIDVTGDWRSGLFCGVEDRNCRDRYDGAEFGHAVGAEKALEWASYEARSVLERINSRQEKEPAP